MTTAVTPATTPGAAPATTGRALDDHDQAMRARASANGKPTLRSLLPGIHLGERIPGFLVLTNKDGDLRARQWGEQASVPVTFPLLIEMWRAVIENQDDPQTPTPDETPGIAVVIADRATLRSLARMARHETKASGGHQEAYGVHRALAYRTGLPFSTVFPVLTQALESRYWMPVDHDTDNTLDWGEVFDLDDPVGSPGWFQALADLASEGDQFDAALMREIVSSEPYGYRAAWYSSSHSQCSAFNQAGKITDAYAAMVASDPLLLARNTLAGDITQVVVTGIEKKYVTARIVGEPGKLREDSQVIVFSGTDFASRGTVRLDGVAVDGADLTATLTVSTRSKARGAVVEAFETGAPLYLTPAPFLAFHRSPANRRWTSDDPGTRPATFEMPADIAAAAGVKD